MTRVVLRASRIGALLALSATAARAVPHRIVSLDPCADPLVVALADRMQVAGVSGAAHDPRRSTIASAARGVSVLRGTPDELAAAHADLVIGAPPGLRAAIARRPGPRPRLLDVPDTRSLAGTEAAIRAVAQAVGYPARGGAMIATMRRDLAGIVPLGRGRGVTIARPPGFLSGDPALMRAIAARAGLVPVAPGARAPFVLLDRVPSRAGPGVPAGRRLVLPLPLALCGGPEWPRAVGLIVRQIRAADGGG